jgi:hypothetical protein
MHLIEMPNQGVLSRSVRGGPAERKVLHVAIRPATQPRAAEKSGKGAEKLRGEPIFQWSRQRLFKKAVVS